MDRSHSPSARQRVALLATRRNEKMARSAHAYMRGSTIKFYEWLDSVAGRAVPQGPEVWICGDCHVGNLGPIANLQGEVDIQIRDLDQTVIGNPAHDVIRLALSLATAIRSSDLPGGATPRMLEQLMAGYAAGLIRTRRQGPDQKKAEAIYRVMEVALQRRWKHLAEERMRHAKPQIPRNARFWDLNAAERRELAALLHSTEMRTLITSLRGARQRRRDQGRGPCLLGQGLQLARPPALCRADRYLRHFGREAVLLPRRQGSGHRGGAAIGFSRDAPGQCGAGGDRRPKSVAPISASACWPGGCKAVPWSCASCYHRISNSKWIGCRRSRPVASRVISPASSGAPMHGR